jgi:hypothetical protein
MTEVKPKGSKATEGRKPTDTTSSTKPLEEVVSDSDLKDVSYEFDTEGLQRIKTIPDDELPPVFIEGEPFCIINEKYVPYDDAQIIFCDNEIERLKSKKIWLRAKSEKEKLTREIAEREIEAKKKQMMKDKLAAEKIQHKEEAKKRDRNIN